MTLSATGISKKYYRPTKTRSHFEAVQKTSLLVESGKITEIIGRSGSGKSTLLYMMAGLLKPTEGAVCLDNVNLYDLGDTELSLLRNETFGVIPQGQSGVFSLSVLENVKLPLTLYKDGDSATDYARELLKILGIQELEDARLSELSGGELRRMAVARALVQKPKIIFADEPTDDLDDENTKTVLSLLKNAADNGAGILLVTHEKEAQGYADSLYKMDGGVLLKL